MNESKVIISRNLDPRHLVSYLLDIDKMTLVLAIFRTGKMTWSNKILQIKISVEKNNNSSNTKYVRRKKNKLQKKSWVSMFNKQSFFSLKA